MISSVSCLQLIFFQPTYQHILCTLLRLFSCSCYHPTCFSSDLKYLKFILYRHFSCFYFASLYSLKLLVHPRVVSGLNPTHFIPSMMYSGHTPYPPLALALHFYAQVSICKIRSFKHECRINASTA